MPKYTSDHVEAALCAWEWMLERASTMEKVWNDNGTCELRMNCAELGPFIDKVYNLIPLDVRDGVCFDWDVVPAIMRHVQWSDGGGYTVPSARVLAPLVTIALKGI